MSSWSSEILPLDSVLEYYSVQRDALIDFQAAILNAFTSGTIHAFERFASLTRDEIFELFINYRLELERSVIFFLLATIEAEIRLHFQKKRSRGREFRALRAKGRSSRVSDILKAWAAQSPDARE